METRKVMKQHAKAALKKHYFVYFIACLLAAVIGIEFVSSIDAFKVTKSYETTSKVDYYTKILSTDDNMYDVLLDGYMEKQELYNENLAERNEDTTVGKVLGHRRGVFASVVNGVSSGSFMTQFVMSIRSMTTSDSIAAGIVVFGGMLLAFAVWFFLKNTYRVTVRRIYLEGRLYPDISKQRFLFLFRVRKLSKSAVTMFLLSVYQTLWNITIIGGMIKHYSYLMVPFIVAENPDISPNAAIKLSCKMMKGHKWEYFVNDLTFIGWYILSSLTLGLLDLFFLNMYRTAYFAECYYNLRGEAKQKQLSNADMLADTYLFEYASDEVLAKEYAVIEDLQKNKTNISGIMKKGFAAWVARWFGISLMSKEVNEQYAKEQVEELTIEKYQNEIERKAYPTRLYIVPEKLKNPRVATINYMRLYSVTSIIMIFFTMCIVGWLWEVSLHLISDGEFVNRGVMHGPWLPIYGSGCTLILVLLNRFRKNPGLEFGATVVLCGLLEYFSSYYLEMANGGTKWWDYSGYFLNLNGRICAEGLLVFGVGGCTVVYFVAPLLDNFFKKINSKLAVIICAILLVSFVSDQIYSKKHPNVGKGITDYAVEEQLQVADLQSIYR